MYKHDDCMCKSQHEHEHMHESMEYARAYIKPQKYENLYSCKEGYLHGTIFVDLYRPYHDHKHQHDHDHECKKMNCER